MAIMTLKHIKALILRGVLDAMQITPVAKMGMLHRVASSGDLAVITAAAHRLACELKWKVGIDHTTLLRGILSNPIFKTKQDRMPAIWILHRRFKMHITRLVLRERSGLQMASIRFLLLSKKCKEKPSC